MGTAQISGHHIEIIQIGECGARMIGTGIKDGIGKGGEFGQVLGFGQKLYPWLFEKISVRDAHSIIAIISINYVF